MIREQSRRPAKVLVYKTDPSKTVTQPPAIVLLGTSSSTCFLARSLPGRKQTACRAEIYAVINASSDIFAELFQGIPRLLAAFKIWRDRSEMEGAPRHRPLENPLEVAVRRAELTASTDGPRAPKHTPTLQELPKVPNTGIFLRRWQDFPPLQSSPNARDILRQGCAQIFSGTAQKSVF